MRKSITALLVTAALVGSSGAIAQRWHGNNGNGNGNGNGGQSWHGNGGGGHGRTSRGDAGGSHGQSRFRMQTQSNDSGTSRWGGRGASNVQGGGDNGRPRWNGGNVTTRSWNGNGAGWNRSDGGSRHYRQDGNGVWRNQRDNDHARNWTNDNRNWNNGGRHDDWRSWRNSNRGLFHLRRYEGPRGYSYRRFYRGYTLQPFFYDQQYWIDDPWQYRLPEAYGPYRWVRYYNDALLVNIYTGEVEDVITDFFW